MDNVVFGNLCGDPVLRQPRRGGRPMARFTVAVNVWRRTEREFVERPPVFHRVVCFGQLAENVTNSLRKGMEVLAVGEWVDDSYTDEQGQRRVQVAMEARAIGPTLRRATAQVHKTERRTDTDLTAVDLDTEQPAAGATGSKIAASSGRPTAATVPRTAPASGFAGAGSKIGRFAGFAASVGRVPDDAGSASAASNSRASDGRGSKIVTAPTHAFSGLGLDSAGSSGGPAEPARSGSRVPDDVGSASAVSSDRASSGHGSKIVAAPARAFDDLGLDIAGSGGQPAAPATSIGRVPDDVGSASAASNSRASDGRGSKIVTAGGLAVGSAAAVIGSGNRGGDGRPAAVAESSSQVPDGPSRPTDSAGPTMTAAISRRPDNPAPETIAPAGAPRDDVGVSRGDVIADLRAAGVIGPASSARGRRGVRRRKEAETTATAAQAG